MSRILAATLGRFNEVAPGGASQAGKVAVAESAKVELQRSRSWWSESGAGDSERTAKQPGASTKSLLVERVRHVVQGHVGLPLEASTKSLLVERVRHAVKSGSKA